MDINEKVKQVMKQTKEKKSIVSEYLDRHKTYIKKFGEKTLVLMQVGSFYEAYATETQGPNLNIIEDLTGACIAHKGKDKNIVDIQNPWMWGFPMVASIKFINILIENGFHLIIIDQVSLPPDIKREVVAIHSPTTYLDLTYKPVSNFVAIIYIEEVKQKHGGVLPFAGMSAIDVSTGEVFIHESYSQLNDDKLSLDEILRFIKSLSPKEIIIVKEKIQKLTDDYIIDYLNLNGQMFQFKDYIPEYNKIAYQKKILEKVYQEQKNMTSIIDALGLSEYNYACKALVNLLVYISDHYINLILGLALPKFYLDNTNLILGNDAINQLNITDAMGGQCLLNILNEAITGMGKRYIKFILVSPLTNPKRLNKIYNNVEIMKNSDIQIKQYLHKISDIERLFRKIELQKLHPMQMVDFITSINQVLELFNIISDSKLNEIFKCSDVMHYVNEITQILTDNININKCKLYNLSNIEDNIFNINIYKNIDKLQQQIDASYNIVDELLIFLNNLMPNKDEIILKHNAREGNYFQLTAKRYEVLDKKLKKLKKITLKSGIINVSDITATRLNNNVKLSMPLLKTQTTNIDELKTELSQLTYTYYIDFMKMLSSYSKHMHIIIDIVTQIDYILTIANVAEKYNYTRPIIDNKQKTGYIVASQLRHPIVERIIEHEYIPHDINIGIDLKGMLIYGLNSAGKSVLMKSIGISIIMAQAGFFVPAQSFVYYPYKSLYTRITGNDNLFKGLSSYTLEIVELNTILKRSMKSTLVIGDEVCRGTEHISGNAIVAATLLKLSDISSTFIFATHLHEIVELDEIKERTNIKAFHLSVDYDEKTDSLIYDRILKDGSGDRIYGIIVAKSIIKDSDFISKAFEIKNKLTNMGKVKKSRYNSELLMDKCSICNRQQNNISNLSKTVLETHHINQQKDCINGFVKNKPHIKKNQLFNLVVLCQVCHDKLHNNEININSIKMTNKGAKIT